MTARAPTAAYRRAAPSPPSALSVCTQRPPSTRCRWTRPVARPAASSRAQASSDRRDDCVALMKCSATPGGGASTTGHSSRAKKSRSSAAMASQSRAHTRPSPSRRRFEAIHAAVSAPMPPAIRPSIASVRVATRCGSSRTRPSIRHARALRLAGGRRRVDDPDLGQRRRGAIGKERQRDLAAERVPDDGIRRRRDTSARGSDARTSSAQAATVCGGSNAGEAPCRRRSTSATAHSGRRPPDRGRSPPSCGRALDAVQHQDGVPRVPPSAATTVWRASPWCRAGAHYAEPAPSLWRGRAVAVPCNLCDNSRALELFRAPLSRIARSGSEGPARRRPQ